MTKIMFVDDDAIIRRNIANKIDWKGHGWELVYTARDPMEALDYLKNHEPDIILTDIKMPGITGIEMAAVAKDYYPNIKFIFISGYKDFEYAQQVLKLNAVDYLTKPVEEEQLIKVIEKAEQLYQKEKEIIRELPEKSSCVIVGRLANHILKDYEKSYHVFISADIDTEIKKTM